MLENAIKDTSRYLKTEYGMHIRKVPTIAVRSCGCTRYDGGNNHIIMPLFAYNKLKECNRKPQVGFLMRAMVNAYQNQVREAEECPEIGSLGYAVSIEGPALLLQADYIDMPMETMYNDAKEKNHVIQALQTARFVTGTIGVRRGIERMAINPMEGFETHIEYASRICRMPRDEVQPIWEFMRMVRQ